MVYRLPITDIILRATEQCEEKSSSEELPGMSNENASTKSSLEKADYPASTQPNYTRSGRSSIIPERFIEKYKDLKYPKIYVYRIK